MLYGVISTAKLREDVGSVSRQRTIDTANQVFRKQRCVYKIQAVLDCVAFCTCLAGLKIFCQSGYTSMESLTPSPTETDQHEITWESSRRTFQFLGVERSLIPIVLPPVIALPFLLLWHGISHLATAYQQSCNVRRGVKHVLSAHKSN